MSENLKARPETAEQKAEEVDNNRYMNIGIPIELKFGNYRVKELDVFSLMTVVADAFDTFMGMADADDESSDLAFLKEAVRKPEFRQQVGGIFALYCGATDSTPFQTIGLSDFSKLLVAVKQVTDFDEIKTAFLELGLQKFLPIPISTEQPSENKTA